MKKIQRNLFLGAFVCVLVGHKGHARYIDSSDAAKNLVMEPPYSMQKKEDKKEDDEEELPPEKLQYDPLTEDLPLLQEREREMERTGGAEYKKGAELSVASTPDFVPKDEEIHEEIPKPDEFSPDQSL